MLLIIVLILAVIPASAPRREDSVSLGGGTRSSA
jgi:hypothetical protein